MAVLTSELIVQLRDMVSAPARAIGTAMRNLESAQKANAARMAEIRGKMVGATVAAYGFYKAVSSPVEAFMNYQTQLEGIAQKADIPRDKVQEIGDAMMKVGEQTNQSSSQIAVGMDTLVGMGVASSDAMKLLVPIGMAATAYGASVEDLSASGYSAMVNLKVPAEQIGQALNGMAVAGKAGAFELSDMALYFPALGAGYQAMGQKGVGAVNDLAAALQAVRIGTADSATAANDVKNLLQKLNAPQTKKAFKKMGIDLEKEMKANMKKGMSPLESIAEITKKAVGGDLSKIGYLFQDMQAQEALRALIQNIDEYKRIRDDANRASGSIDSDFRNRMKTTAERFQALKLRVENLGIKIGAALVPVLERIAELLVPIVEKITAWVKANPELVATIAKVVGGLMLLNITSLIARWSFGSVVGLFLKASKVSFALPLAGLVGIAAALYEIESNKKAAFDLLDRHDAFIGPKQPRKETNTEDPMKPNWQPIGTDIAADAGLKMNHYIRQQFFEIDQAYREWNSSMNIKLAELGASISSAIGVALQDISTKFHSYFDGLPAQMKAAGSAAMAALLAGLMAGGQAALDYVSGLATEIGNTVSSAITGPGGPSPIYGKGYAGRFATYPKPQTPTIAGARAAGGAIVGGKTYLVGERGPELRTFGSSGHIIPNHKLGGNQVSIGTIVINGAQNADQIAREIGGKIKQALTGIHSDLEYAPGH
jgi:TP901 family phage tail tape measure protein